MFINTETLEYPLTEAQVKARFPQQSFPKPFVAPEPYAVLFSRPKPNYDEVTHTAAEGTPAMTEANQWEQMWVLSAFDEATVAANTAALLQSRKESACAEVDELREEKFWINYPYGSTFVQFRNNTDQLRLTNLRQFADSGYPVPLILEDNTVINFTPANFIALSSAIMSNKSEINIVARNIKNSILAAVDSAELDAIDITVGWPVV